MKYEDFLNFLRNQKTTEEVLLQIYNYFRNNVSYNYDQLQVVKYNNRDGELNSIHELIENNKDNKSEEFKNKLINSLDEVFMKLEGRGLSKRNKEEWFKNYGKVIHHEKTEKREITIRRGMIIRLPGEPEHDEIIHIEPNYYEPIYENDMLKDGVCGEYSLWVRKICNDLGIPCLLVVGKGTTGHAWNIIYLKEENKWVHFDMTMVRFYLDNWSKKFGNPEEWVFATTSDIFRLQPDRLINRILGNDDVDIFRKLVNKDNPEDLDEFLNSLVSLSRRK